MSQQWGGPAHGHWIVDGLSNANIEAMTLFSALSDGARKSQFPKYLDRYDRLMGTLYALETHVRAQILRAPDGSATALDKDAADPIDPILGMLQTVKQMRDTHAMVGLTAAEVAGLREIWSAYAQEALAYEHVDEEGRLH